ncbi:unnamed protein product [Ixodes persulcatus]
MLRGRPSCCSPTARAQCLPSQTPRCPFGFCPPRENGSMSTRAPRSSSPNIGHHRPTAPLREWLAGAVGGYVPRKLKRRGNSAPLFFFSRFFVLFFLQLFFLGFC